jgi:hypothetical protein
MGHRGISCWNPDTLTSPIFEVSVTQEGTVTNALQQADVLAALDELFGAIDKYRTTEGFRELLAFLRKMPAVGPYNALLLHIQRPGASYVATLRGWAQLDRTVRRDANPLVTLRPFGPVEFVYDIADTTGPDLHEDLSEPLRATGRLDPAALARTREHAERDGIAVCDSDLGRALAGRVSGQLPGREVVKLRNGEPALLVVDLAKRLSTEGKFATLVHELAHIYCGHLVAPSGAWWPCRKVDYTCKEFEAEAVAWIVCARQGIDPGSYRYLEGFLKPDARLPDVSLNQIMVAANHIERLTTERPSNKHRDGKRPPLGGSIVEGSL